MAAQPVGIQALLWRAVVVYRIATLMYAGALLLQAHKSYAHPTAGLFVLALMISWTVVMTVAELMAGGRRIVVVAADVAVCVALTMSSMWVQTYEQSHGGSATLTTIWAASAVLGCATLAGPWGGAAGAALIGASSIVTRGTLTVATFNNVVLLFLVGAIGGYAMRLVLRAESQLAQAARIEAAIKERERLARTIHDGVLQVLALVRQSGASLPRESAELSRLAGEQEVALRNLIRSERLEAESAHRAVSSDTDIRTLLIKEATTSVEFSAPAGPVLLETGAAQELTAAARAALDNVSRHAGPRAQAWILLEDFDEQVVVTVRDDGVGFPLTRLAEAEAQGRMGVAFSIRSRIEELGGSVHISSMINQGTEVEITLPRQRSEAR